MFYCVSLSVVHWWRPRSRISQSALVHSHESLSEKLLCLKLCNLPPRSHGTESALLLDHFTLLNAYVTPDEQPLNPSVLCCNNRLRLFMFITFKWVMIQSLVVHQIKQIHTYWINMKLDDLAKEGKNIKIIFYYYY